MQTNDKIKIDELKKLVFETKQPLKQNKDKLLKLAKQNDDLETIKRLQDELNFKRAKEYLSSLNKKDETICIDTSPDIKNNTTPLMVAAHAGDIDLCGFLISEGADIDKQNDNGDTALMLAAKENHEGIVKLLLEKGADANIVKEKVPRDGEFYFSKAIDENLDNDNILNMLLETTFLNIAEYVYYVSDIKLIEKKLDICDDINVKDRYGCNVLHAAAGYGNSLSYAYNEVLYFFMKKGVDIDAQDYRYGQTPLILSAQCPNVVAIEILLNNDAKINTKDKDGNTALMVAVKYNYVEAIRKLMEYSPNLDIQNNKGETALHLAIAWEADVQGAYSIYENELHLELIQTLVNKKIDLDLQDKNGDTALMIAVKNNDIKLVELLLNAGANTYININESDIDFKSQKKSEVTNTDNGYTALTLACLQIEFELTKDTEIVKLLLNKRDRVESFEVPYLDLLLHNNDIAKLSSNLLVDDKSSVYTLLMSIIIYHHKELQAEKYFATNYKDNNEPTRFMEYEIYEDTDESKKYMESTVLINCNNLLKNGVDINYKYETVSALTLAEERGMTEVVKLLNTYLSKNTSRQPAIVVFNNNQYSITFFGDKIIFTDNFNFRIDEIQKYENMKNSYIDSLGNIFFIKNNSVIQRTINNIEIEHTPISITGNVLEINHNPRRLVELLTNFRNDTPLKYTTHDWDDEKFKNDFKKEYGDFQGYLAKVKKQWYEIESELFELSEILHAKIYNFLINDKSDYTTWCSREGDALNIGWSSLEGLENWVDDGNDPFDFETRSYKIEGKTINTFGDLIKLFKREIQIRTGKLKCIKENNMLKNIFKNINKNHTFDFKLDFTDMKMNQVYTDIAVFKSVIMILFKQFTEESDYKTIKIESCEDCDDKYYVLKVIQVGSFSNRTATQMEEIVEGGDFSRIKENLTNICDWSVESSNGKENYRINFLISDDRKVVERDVSPIGYTHIFRFYIK